MQAKLGFAAWHAGEEADDGLLDTLHRLLERGEVDMTIFFRSLAEVDVEAPSLAPFADAFYDEGRRAGIEAELSSWLQAYAARLRDEVPAAVRRAGMNRVNPLYVPRNYLAQQAIDAAEAGDLSELETLFDVLRQP